MKDLYRKFWRNAASPVTIITTEHAKKLAGMTVSSLASVSMGPPQLLVSFNCQAPSRTIDVLNKSNKLVLNLMSTNPNNILLAKEFAGRTAHGHNSNPFELYKHMFEYKKESRSIPLIKNACGQLFCEIISSQKAQDHNLFLASVQQIWALGNEPLVYQNHRFCGLGNALDNA